VGEFARRGCTDLAGVDVSSRMIDEVRRALKPGGLLYVSDLHHSPPGRLAELLAGFESVDVRTMAVRTMNGHSAGGVQLLVREGAAT